MIYGAQMHVHEPPMSHDVASPSMVLIPADLASIAVVRAALLATLKERGWDPDSAQGVVLATSEAVANAVEHGSHAGELVEVVHQVGVSEATVRILDSGGSLGWDRTLPDDTPPTNADRGRGLAIIRALAHRMEIRPAGRGTELRLDFVRV
jgi:anti-sigma regulatory factor (Ser/Thr protein kinase)